MNNLQKYFLPLFVLLNLSGCATGYHPKGFGGGYSDMSLGNDLYKVSFRGNGYTNKETVTNYFLRRCAELTKEKGFDYFLIVDQNSSSSVYDLGSTTAGTINQNYVGGYNYTAETTSNYVKKHLNEGTIKLFKEGQHPTNAYNANVVLSNFEK